MSKDLWEAMPDERDGKADADLTWGCEKCAWAESYPNLYAMIARYQTGSGKRQGSRMSIQCKNGSVVMILTEPSRGLVAFIDSSTILGVFDAAEQGLGAGTLNWKQDQFVKKDRASLPY